MTGFKNELKLRLFVALFISFIFAFSFGGLAQYENCSPNDCDDNNPCTEDACREDGCVHTLKSCDGGDPCTAYSCDPAIGCVQTPKNCDDGDPCTSDYCGAGGCVHEQIDCDDGNANTTDSCSSSGCVNAPIISNERVADNSESINVGEENAANNNTTTAESFPVAEKGLSSPPDCDDGNPCTADVNNGTSCTHTELNCDDGNASTLDSCEAGICVNEPIIGSGNSSTTEAMRYFAHQPDCNDSDLCTIDSFNEKECVHTPKNCDDGNASTFDYCYNGNCVHTLTSCDDGNACTTDSYNGTSCTHTPKNCNDGNACTQDFCEGGRCVHKSKNCDDGNACTLDACDGRGNCVHPLRNCNDGNPCTVDACDYYWGCIHTPVVCAPGKTCVNGICQAIPTAAPTGYIIPAGSAITLPWGAAVTALDSVRVENGVAYVAGTAFTFTRPLGSSQAATNAASDRAEMVGLTWVSNPFGVTLIKPDGSILNPQSDSQNIKRVSGTNYDYYFLRNLASGYWTIQINPLSPGRGGEGFSLITGPVGGTASSVQS